MEISAYFLSMKRNCSFNSFNSIGGHVAKRRVDNRRYNKHRTNLMNGAKDVSHSSRRRRREEYETYSPLLRRMGLKNYR